MGMHFGIGLFLGLWPFSIAMIALDLVFVGDASWVRALARVREIRRSSWSALAAARAQRAKGRSTESGTPALP